MKPSTVNEWITLGWKVGTVICLCGIMYLQVHYASKEEVEKIQSDINQIKVALAKTDNVPVVLLDHETRIRMIERLVFTNNKTSYYEFLLETPKLAKK